MTDTVSQPGAEQSGSRPSDDAARSSGVASQPAQAGAFPADLQRIRQEVAERKATEAADRAEAIEASKGMRLALGDEYAPTMRALRAHLASMSHEEREKLLREESSDGRLVLNTP